MTALDIVVLILVAGGAFAGFRRGFVHEILGLAAWVVGIVAVKLLHAPVTAMLDTSVGSASGAAALAFALTFGVAFVVVKLLAARIGGATRRSIVGPIDRVLGAGFGLLKGLIGATLIFLLVNLVTDLGYGDAGKRPAWLTKSRTYPLLDASSRALVDIVDRRHGHAAPVSDAEANR